MAIALDEDMIRAHWESLLGSPSYRAALDAILASSPEGGSLIIPFQDLIAEGMEFAESFVREPRKHLEIASEAISTILREGVEIRIRVTDLPRERRIPIRSLRSRHIGTFVSVEGIVRRITEVHPRLVRAVFVPRGKGEVAEEVEVKGARIPRVSPKFRLDKERSVFRDFQRLEIQELPESVTGGTSPARLRAELYDDLTGILNPGDRIVLNGILDVREKGAGKAEFDMVLEVNSFEYLEGEPEELEITEDDERRIRELAKGDVFPKLVRSIAPSIYGLEKIKETLALQLFGGVPKVLPDGTRIRGDIHLLLIGDPGTAKSQLLRYMAQLAPRGLYTHGKGASAAGLTAAAVKDEFGEGRWTLEAGALVLADQGLVAIDEIDKMSDQDRVAMHEAMEQQVVSISKAGITATLQARTSILGAANPKYGRFAEQLEIAEQINLPVTLLSRFDAIFVIADRPDETRDRDLAMHILDAHELGERLSRGRRVERAELLPEIDPLMLKKYVLYARKNVFPILSKAAKDRIAEYFVRLRAMSTDKVSITPRQLESLIRFAEASARARLSETVDLEDAERAISVIEYWLSKVLGGDVDRIMIGMPSGRRSLVIAVLTAVEKLQDRNADGAFVDDIYDEVRRVMESYGRTVTKDEVIRVLERLTNQGDLYRKRHGFYKRAGQY